MDKCTKIGFIEVYEFLDDDNEIDFTYILMRCIDIKAEGHRF